MKTIMEPARSTEVMAETDVLVVGSGPGGMAAAISAARAGARVILMERYACFGGVITQVGVETISWYRYEGTVDTEGIGIEFEERARNAGGTYKMPYAEGHALNTEMFKVVADHMLMEAGVTPLLQCMAVEAIMDGPIIRGVVTESKMGRKAILAKRIIDATGDADIAKLAGAAYRTTPKNEAMGVTVNFACSGVDKQKFLDYVKSQPGTFKDWDEGWKIRSTGKEDELLSPYLAEPFDKARAEGLIPPEMTSITGTWSTLTDNGEATYLNLVYMTGVDATDVWDTTRAEMEGRHQAVLAIQALNKYVPGFENATLRNFGMRLGTRDSRKIIGRYDLTEADVLGEGRFDDSIGIFPEFLDGYGVLALPTTGRYFHLPYGSLVPQDVDNLLVAGRCIAGDKMSHAAVRNMMCCCVTGQGAGVAAATSAKHDMSTGSVDVELVQSELTRQGVRIQ